MKYNERGRGYDVLFLRLRVVIEFNPNNLMFVVVSIYVFWYEVQLFADNEIVEDCPEGYPRLAAFLDSDENFMLYRRFGFLQSRLLLHKQDQLRELEKDLDRLDKVDQIQNPTLLKSREKDNAENGKREKLLSQVEDKFKEYGNCLR